MVETLRTRPPAKASLLVRLSTRLNPIVSVILTSRAHWLLSYGLTLITVTGRRTGRHYTIPVGYHQLGDAVIVLVNDAPAKLWWRNYQTPESTQLRLRGHTIKGTAETLHPATPEFRHYAEASFRRSRLIARIFGIRFDPRRGLTDVQIEQLARRAIVRVTLDEHSQGGKALGVGRA